MDTTEETEEGHGSRESLSSKYPEAYVRAIRDTPIELSPGNSKGHTPLSQYATAGVGLRDLGRMQVIPVRSMYDIDYFPIMAGQEALRDVEKAKIKRARDKAMEELNSILNRVKFTLVELKTADNELTLIETPEFEQETRKNKKRRRRRKKKKESIEEKTETKGEIEDKGKIENVVESGSQEENTKDGQSEEKAEEPTQQVPTPLSPESLLSSLDSDASGSSYTESEEESSEDEEHLFAEEQQEAADVSTVLPYFSTPPGMKKTKAVSPTLIKRAERRRRTSDAIAGYLEQCIEREDIMQQMKSWIETTASEEPPRPVSQLEDQRYSPGLLKDDLPLDIGGAVDSFKLTLVKLKKIADSLGIGSEKSDEEAEEAPAKPGLPPPPKPKVGVKIFDENELSVPGNFDMAITSLSKALNEAAKSTPARRTRILLNNSLKQFNFVCKAIDTRDEKIKQLEGEVIDRGGEIVKLKKQNEELRKNKKKMQVKCDKLEHQTDDLKLKLKKQEASMAELTKVIEEYKRKESYGLYRESSSEESSGLSSEDSYAFLDELEPEKKSKKKGKKAGKGKAKAAKKAKKKSTTSGTSEASEILEKVEVKEDAGETKEPSGDVTISLADIENTEVYQELKMSFETAERAVMIEREKLAELETEFENVKTEKVNLEQEKADMEIEIENMKREQEIEIEELKDQVDDLERENKKQRSEIECNEEMIQYQEERIAQYAEEIEKLEDRLMSLPATPAMSSTSFAKTGRRDRRRSTVGLIEPPTARQMMAKIKQQYETEIQGLKDHVTKEAQRHQADTRRRDQEHKKDIQNIHKESVLVLRAINRFKDCAATLLEREQLVAEAHTLRKLPPLLLDDTPGETRQMLARMAILSNELLVSIELQLSKALMSKRLEMKDTTISRSMVKKELESQTENLRKAKDVSAAQTGKLKAAREVMMEQEQEFHRFKLKEGEKKEILEERYKELLAEYITLRREGTAAKKEARQEREREKDEEITRKETIIQKYMRREKGMQRMLEEQKKVITNLSSAWQTRRFGQLFISKEDQLENLKTLSEALNEDKISKHLHEMTTNLIKEAIDLPRKRFIELVQKYTRFVHLREMEARAKQLRLEDDMGEGSSKFIYMLEQRLKKQRELWNKRRDELVKQRADILMQLSRVLTRVSEEADILLAKPKRLTRRVGEVPKEETGIPDLYEAVKLMNDRERLRKLRGAQITARIPLAEREGSPPSGTVTGYTGFQRPPMWKLKAVGAYSHVVVATPRILDIDVNQTRLAAHQIITEVSKGNIGSTSLPKLKTLTSKVYDTPVRKSTSEPSPDKDKYTDTNRSLVLPPIATMYSTEDWSKRNE